MTRVPLKQRLPDVERMWAEGATLREIADAIGCTPESLGVRFAKWRREGIADLPYRNIHSEPRHAQYAKPIPTERDCVRCDETKLIGEFKSGDRLSNCCRACRRQRAAEHRQSPRRKALAREESRRWQHANPEKTRAHSAVTDALRSGRLVRPEACERCGEAGRVHAHHEDYLRRLDVMWLCPPCHAQRHAGHWAPEAVAA